MPDFTKIAEAKIREALKKGELDNLPGKGQPLDLSDYFSSPRELRACFQLLKNAGVMPQEIQLLNEIAALKQKVRNTKPKNALKDLEVRINEKTTQLHILLERYRRRKKLS